MKDSDVIGDETAQLRFLPVKLLRQLISCFPGFRLTSSERRADSPSRTPPAGTTSPSPTPPATPARRGDFTRAEYARRHQLKIMDDLDKVLQQKSAGQARTPAKKARSRPRSMTREETQLSLSPAKTRTTGAVRRGRLIHQHAGAFNLSSGLSLQAPNWPKSTHTHPSTWQSQTSPRIKVATPQRKAAGTPYPDP